MIIPPSVKAELETGQETGRISACDWSQLQIVELSPEAESISDRLQRTLSRGEADCIALSQQHGWGLLTDDRNARREASSRGLIVSGTIGVLVRLVNLRVLTVSQADVLLARMRAHGYFSPVESLAELDL